LLLKEL